MEECLASRAHARHGYGYTSDSPLMDVCLIGVHLVGVHLMDVDLTGVHLMAVPSLPEESTYKRIKLHK